MHHVLKSDHRIGSHPPMVLNLHAKKHTRGGPRAIRREETSHVNQDAWSKSENSNKKQQKGMSRDTPADTHTWSKAAPPKRCSKKYHRMGTNLSENHHSQVYIKRSEHHHHTFVCTSQLCWIWRERSLLPTSTNGVPKPGWMPRLERIVATGKAQWGKVWNRWMRTISDICALN